MNSRERVEAAFDHRTPDRTPVFEYVLLSPLADQILGRTYGGDPAHWDGLVAELGWEQAVGRNAADRVELAVILGHDMIYASPVQPPPSLVGLPSALPGQEPSADPVENLKRRNQAAAAAAPAATERHLIYSLLRQEMAARDVDLPILAPAYGHGVWTDVDLMQTMILDPGVAHRHFQLATRSALTLISQYRELGIELVGIGGDFAGNRPIISPEAYRSFIVPEVARLSRQLHAWGMRAVNASDGDLWSVIDDFLLGCEVDAYLEIDQYAGMDLPRLKQRFGDRITFLGNLDCGTVLSFATPDEVKQHTIDSLEAGRGHGGHVLCASNAITASVPMENYLALVNAYRDYWGMPAMEL
jgi:uroporphyrinogen decarboxylase